MIRVLPWVAAWTVPVIGSALGYWAVGADLLGMVVGSVLAGVIGLSGAAMYWVTERSITSYCAKRAEKIIGAAYPDGIMAGEIAAGTLRAQVTLGEGVRFYSAEDLEKPYHHEGGACCEAGALAHPDPCPWHYEPPHEGVAPHRPPPDYEPPTRG